MTCAGGASPYASFDGATGLITASKLRSHPTAVTVATWFNVASGDAGGVLADFGSSPNTTASIGLDDGLYMGDTGRLTFGTASIQALGLIQTGYKYCTTASGYADGTWHLVVATHELERLHDHRRREPRDDRVRAVRPDRGRQARTPATGASGTTG